jgi:nucleotide-binding universal stress UspA family protein
MGRTRPLSSPTFAMAHFKSILAPTDLSGHAREAVLRAARIARDTGAALHLVHVLQIAALDALRNRLAAAPADLRARLDNAARFGLEELAETIRRDHGVEAALRCVDGDLLAEIRRAARETSADLVVFGARGASVARHLLLGSTAERLLGQAGCSMLVVRRPAEVTYRRVLVPVDFSEGSLPALLRAQALAPQGRIHALHAYEAPFEGKLRLAGLEDDQLQGYVQGAAEEALRHMAALVAQAPREPRVQTLLLHGHPLAHVLDQEEELDCQLVVVGQGSGSRADDLLLGSLSRRVLAQSTADVLLSV